MGGYRRPAFEPHRQWLLDQVKTCSHVTLAKLQEMLKERGVEVSHDTVWRFPGGCDFRFKKKTLVADERERPDVKRRRDRWQRHQGKIDQRRWSSSMKPG